MCVFASFPPHSRQLISSQVVHMNFTSKTELFEEWLADSGAELSTKIRVADLRDMGQGRAVVATEDIEEDEELFKLPRSLLINAENCSLVLDKVSLKETLSALGQWQALILLVFYDWKVKGDQSRWYPYFQILPVNDQDNYIFNQLMYWTPLELELLIPSFVIRRIGKESAKRLYDEMKDLLTEYIGEVSQAEFNDVATLIMSYSFDVDRINSEADNIEAEEEEGGNDDCPVKDSHYFKSMVPLADTINADTHAHNAILMYSDEYLIMRSISKIPKGAQIFNSYSQHPNSEILRRYGYVEKDGSAYDFAEISQNEISTYFDRNQKFEKVMDCVKLVEEEKEENFVLDTYDFFVSGEVIPEFIFLIQLLVVIFEVDKNNAFLESSPEIVKEGIKRIYEKCYQLIDSKKLTEGFLAAYKSILKERLSQYPSDIETFSGSQSRRPDQAKIVLKSEVTSLKNCLQVEKVFFEGEEKYTEIDGANLLRDILSNSFFKDDSNRPLKRLKSE